jgi:VIT1/CCC1 family predicted Fe2+/Mn2+ transporter
MGLPGGIRAPRRGRLVREGAAEHHDSGRIGWLRAAVLGANDGIVSTASLVLGGAAAGAEHRTVLLSSVSALIAGAMSVAAGEFVSVHSQEDTENADLARERTELQQDRTGPGRDAYHSYPYLGTPPT